jgi:hypothetical protein
VVLALTLSAISVAMQTKKAVSPFDKYRQTTANDLTIRWLKLDVAALQKRVSPENGIVVPVVQGISEDGKLVIQVDVYSSELPKTVDGRKEAMLSAVGVALAAFSYSFEPGLEPDFNKNARVVFFDIDKLLKGKKPVDPIIGIYENGELVLR